jgi:hypothetical protein
MTLGESTRNSRIPRIVLPQTLAQYGQPQCGGTGAPFAAFAKKDDLRYLLKVICQMDCHHLPELAPPKEMLDTYKKQKGAWATYEPEFLELLRARKVQDT